MAKKNFGERIEQGKLIAKALTTPLPVGQKWFEDRLKICNGCEFNTKNSPYNTEEMSIIEKAELSVKNRVCDSKNYCRACGCCIELKVSLKEIACGLSEMDNPPEEPKWFALETVSPISKDISIVNLSPEVGKTSTETSNIVYDFGETSAPKLTANFQLKRKGGFKIKTFSVGCSCTVANPTVIDNDTVEFSIDISTLSFKEGLNKRSMIVTYYEKSNITKSVNIMFKITKNGK